MPETRAIPSTFVCRCRRSRTLASSRYRRASASEKSRQRRWAGPRPAHSRCPYKTHSAVGDDRPPTHDGAVRARRRRAGLPGALPSRSNLVEPLTIGAVHGGSRPPFCVSRIAVSRAFARECRSRYPGAPSKGMQAARAGRGEREERPGKHFAAAPGSGAVIKCLRTDFPDVF